MAISKKPTPTITNPNPITELEIESLIKKGGSPAIEKDGTGKEKPVIKLVQLRMLEDILFEIDEIRNRHKGHPKPSRHSWIMNAVIEKIDREK